MLATVKPIQDLDALAAEGAGNMLPDPLGSIADDHHPPQDGLLTATVGVQTAPANDVQRPTPRGFGPETGRKAGGCLARRNVAGVNQLAVLPGANQAQLDLVPVAFDQRAVQRAITIARHHAIGLHDQRLALCHWGILGRRFLSGLHLLHGGPLFAFEFGTGSLSMGPQRFDAHVHPKPRFRATEPPQRMWSGHPTLFPSAAD